MSNNIYKCKNCNKEYANLPDNPNCCSQPVVEKDNAVEECLQPQNPEAYRNTDESGPCDDGRNG